MDIDIIHKESGVSVAVHKGAALAVLEEGTGWRPMINSLLIVIETCGELALRDFDCSMGDTTHPDTVAAFEALFYDLPWTPPIGPDARSIADPRLQAALMVEFECIVANVSDDWYNTYSRRWVRPSNRKDGPARTESWVSYLDALARDNEVCYNISKDWPVPNN